MNRTELMDYFNKKPRIGALATADGTGNVNAAVFGSPRMMDENTVVMGIGRNRSFAYLKENPRAVFIIMEPGDGPMEWNGIRVYLTVDSIETEGELFDEFRAGIARAAGEKSAEMMHALIRFSITEVRRLIAAP